MSDEHGTDVPIPEPAAARDDAVTPRPEPAAARTRRRIRRPSWLPLDVLVASLATILVIALLLVGRAIGNPEAAADAAAQRYETEVAAYDAVIASLRLPSGEGTDALAQSGLAGGSLLSMTPGVDGTQLASACMLATGAAAVAQQPLPIPAPDLDEVAVADPPYAYEDAVDRLEQDADAYEAAATLFDDLDAASHDAAQLCGPLVAIEDELAALQRSFHVDSAVAFGAVMQTVAGPVTCSDPQGCMADGIPAWDYPLLGDDHRAMGEAFALGCGPQLADACAAASAALAQLSLDDYAVGSAWAHASADDAGAAEAVALQSALDDREERLSFAWTGVDEAARTAVPDAESFEDAIALTLQPRLADIATTIAAVTTG